MLRPGGPVEHGAVAAGAAFEVMAFSDTLKSLPFEIPDAAILFFFLFIFSF